MSTDLIGMAGRYKAERDEKARELAELEAEVREMWRDSDTPLGDHWAAHLRALRRGDS